MCSYRAVSARNVPCAFARCRERERSINSESSWGYPVSRSAKVSLYFTAADRSSSSGFGICFPVLFRKPNVGNRRARLRSPRLESIRSDKGERRSSGTPFDHLRTRRDGHRQAYLFSVEGQVHKSVERAGPKLHSGSKMTILRVSSFLLPRHSPSSTRAFSDCRIDLKQTYNRLPSTLSEYTPMSLVFNTLTRTMIIASMMIAVLVCEHVINQETSDGYTHFKGVSCVLYNHLFQVVSEPLRSEVRLPGDEKAQDDNSSLLRRSFPPAWTRASWFGIPGPAAACA